jgi:hypothetical protein
LIASLRQGTGAEDTNAGVLHFPQRFLGEVPLVKINLPPYTPRCEAAKKFIDAHPELVAKWLAGTGAHSAA